MSIKRSIQSKGDERPRKRVANNEVEQEAVVIEGSENEEADENEAGEDVEWIGDGVLDSIDRSLISEGELTSDENESGHIALKGFTQETVLALIPSGSSDELIDEWLSPRMMKMFEITAELSVNIVKEDSDVFFVKDKATPLSQCAGVFGVHLIHYIPTEILHQNCQGLYKSFCDGWGIVWSAIVKVIHNRQAPTITRIEQEIHAMGADLRKWHHFQQKGGKIDYALDALFDVTKKVYRNGDYHWVYNNCKDDIEKIPATESDDMFDVAQAKCFETDICQVMGPYFHNFSDF